MKKISFILIIISFLLIQSIYSQNVGIGTTTPTKGKLEVYGAVGVTSAIFGGDGAGISLQRNYPAIGFNQYYGTDARHMAAGAAFVQYLDMLNGNLVFQGYYSNPNPNAVAQRQSQFLIVRQNGDIAINQGNFNSYASLFVGNWSYNYSSVRFRGTTHHSVFSEFNTHHTYINAGKTGSHVFINDQGLGNVFLGGGTTSVGINSPDPSGALEIKQVAGRGLLLVAPAYSFNNWEFVVNHELNEAGSDLWVKYNGQYKGNFFHVDGAYYQASDRRLKDNIQPMQSILSKVIAMRPVEYEMKYNNEGHIKSIGFIAQEVKSLFPELTRSVEGEEHGHKGIKDLLTMNYDGLGPIAIKALQEQQQKIKTLTERNADLSKRLEKAEKDFAAINK